MSERRATRQIACGARLRRVLVRGSTNITIRSFGGVMPAIFSSIKGRLIFASVLTAVLTFSALVMTFYMGGLIRAEFRYQSEVVGPLNTALQGMNIAGLNQGSLLRERLLLSSLNKKQVEELRKYSTLFEQDYSTAVRLSKDFPSLAPMLKAIDKDWKVVNSARGKIQEAVVKVQPGDALIVVPTEEKGWKRLHAKLESAVDYIDAQKALAQKKIDADLRNSRWWSTGLLLLAMIIGGGTLLLTIVGTVRRIGSTLSMMKAATTGDADLSRRVAVRGTDEMDQIGLAFNAFLERIQGVIAQVARSASMVSSAADGMSSMSAQVRSGIEQQRSDTTQVAAAVNEMNATAHEVAKNIEETSNVSGRAAAASKHGAELATSAIEGMGTLQNELGLSSDAIAELSKGVLEIGGVVDLISQVAEQTNLLGEQGRGFAVVADEVRSLAHKTQDSTSQISSMIERLRGAADSVVTSMDRTRAQSESASGEVDQVGESLTEITGMVRDIADRAAQVATAAEEQSAVAEEINRNVTSISTATDQTATSIDHSMGAAHELSRLAGELNQLVAQFKGV
ncbi:MAG: methyl-accepting chemotaxis protein [Acidihalobacter sp.]